MRNKKVLLLGAGFTANFGAPVARQVWNDFFNSTHIQNSSKLRATLMLYNENSDFEGFYNHVIHGIDFTREEKKTVAVVVILIFNNMNLNLDRYLSQNNSPAISYENLAQFLKMFSNMESGKGFIFTLNQDLFLEKLINVYLRSNNQLQYSIASPFINQSYIDISWKSEFLTQDKLDELLLDPNIGGKLYANKKFPYYVKLHGSSGWLSNGGKISIPVIGKNKQQQINSEPLLRFYMELFDKILNDTVDIWIIGYSFSDPHINNVLIDSMRKHDSVLYVVDIKPFDKFMEGIKAINEDLHDLMNEKLHGYFPNTLNQIFPRDDLSDSIYTTTIFKSSLYGHDDGYLTISEMIDS